MYHSVFCFVPLQHPLQNLKPPLNQKLLAEIRMGQHKKQSQNCFGPCKVVIHHFRPIKSFLRWSARRQATSLFCKPRIKWLVVFCNPEEASEINNCHWLGSRPTFSDLTKLLYSLPVRMSLLMPILHVQEHGYGFAQTNNWKLSCSDCFWQFFAALR